MPPASVLAAARAAGVELAVDGNELRFRCRAGSLPRELRAQLKEHRAQLIRLLQIEELVHAVAEERLPRFLPRTRRHGGGSDRPHPPRFAAPGAGTVWNCRRCFRAFGSASSAVPSFRNVSAWMTGTRNAQNEPSIGSWRA